MSAIDVDKNWQLLINGEWVDPAAGTYDVIDCLLYTSPSPRD